MIIQARGRRKEERDDASEGERERRRREETERDHRGGTKRRVVGSKLKVKSCGAGGGERRI